MTTTSAMTYILTIRKKVVTRHISENRQSTTVASIPFKMAAAHILR